MDTDEHISFEPRAVCAGGVSEISIVDLTGKVVMQRSLPAGMHQLRVDELVAGVYLVEVRVGGVRGVRRLVVG